MLYCCSGRAGAPGRMHKVDMVQFVNQFLPAKATHAGHTPKVNAGNVGVNSCNNEVVNSRLVIDRRSGPDRPFSAGQECFSPVLVHPPAPRITMK
jgi:hypothetical protein